MALGTKPLYRWAFDALHAAGCAPIVVVVPEGWRGLVTSENLPDAVVVDGGPTRRASVAAGLGEVASPAVVVHDAARPFASPDLVRRVVSRLPGADGVIPVLPMVDAVKRVEEDLVTESLRRSQLWRVQTPQAFSTDSLRRAHERAPGGMEAADDAELVEMIGGRVAVVAGEPTNRKITYPIDLEWARWISETRPAR